MAIDWNKMFPPVEEEFLKHGFLSQPLRPRKSTETKQRKQARKRQKLARRVMRLHR